MQRLFSVLSSETRLRILEILLESKKPLCYCELVEDLGKDRSVVYRHFKKLEKSGLLKVEKKGKKLEGTVKKPEEVRKFLEIAKKVSEDGS